MPPRHWLNRSNTLATLLRPLAWVYAVLRSLHFKLYVWGVFKTQRLPVPVVIVGNVVAGGAGKTPVVIALVKHLQALGCQPGVIARGYGRTSKDCRIVTSASTAAEVGDEPLLIARVCHVPVAVATQRVEAARTLLAAHPTCNVLISDDGLQHLALGRDVEIVLFDERDTGNKLFLPAGPLREPWPRKTRCPVHLVLSDVNRMLASYAQDASGVQHPLNKLAHHSLHAVAGIAKPAMFFAMLRAQGLHLASTTAYADHDNFFAFNQAAMRVANPEALWLCTEKDAVKLWAIAPQYRARILAVPLCIELDTTFLSIFDTTMQFLISRPQGAA